MSGLTVLVNAPARAASDRPGKASGRAIPGPAATAAMMEIRDEMLTSARGQDNLLFMRERSSSRLTKELVLHLWAKTYNTEGKPDWSHILPYYDDNIYFRDSIQEIRGIEEFTAMTERLAKRSKDLKMKIVNAVMEGDLIMMEWEMTIKFKKNPSSVLYGSSRLTLNGEGRIIQQRDYYDLWGDIFDNIPRFGKAYRKFMIRKFG
jgi:limonene-1,2-epoxide hydrolase